MSCHVSSHFFKKIPNASSSSSFHQNFIHNLRPHSFIFSVLLCILRAFKSSTACPQSGLCPAQLSAFDTVSTSCRSSIRVQYASDARKRPSPAVSELHRLYIVRYCTILYAINLIMIEFND